MYVPNDDGGSPEFTSSANFISLNPSVIINTGTFDLPCFLAGTMIATPGGDCAVETLQPGDLVLTPTALPSRSAGSAAVPT